MSFYDPNYRRFNSYGYSAARSYAPSASKPASDKQKAFVLSLASERTLPQDLAQRVHNAAMSQSEASALIDALKAIPSNSPRLASPKQVEFVVKLISERFAEGTFNGPDPATLTGAQASQWIDRLLTMPKLPAPSKATARVYVPDSIPEARYAIPASALAGKHKDSMVLFRVTPERELWQLVGAPGSFAKQPVSKAVAETALAVLLADPHTAALAFSQQYTRCAKCGAELSDDESKRIGLGPVCREAFGL